jgi:hypothetical protein
MSIILQGSTSGSVTLQEPAVAGATVLDLPATSGTVVLQNASNNLLMNSGYGSNAVAYGCRAWINFNGTGTVAIRASGNVTSVSDGGVGDYTVNLTTAMPDINYAPVASDYFYGDTITLISSTLAFRVFTYNQGVSVDPSAVYVAVFR